MKLFKIDEAARAVGLTPYALRVGTRRGEYPFVFVGRRYLYDVNMLEETIRARMARNQQRQQADGR